MTQETFIRVCTEHKKQVPLIFTMAFPGFNYWCPECGITLKAPDDKSKVPLTATLTKRRDDNLEKTKEFLQASNVMNTDKRIMFGAMRVKKEDLPQSETDRLQKIVDEYEYPLKKKK